MASPLSMAARHFRQVTFPRAKVREDTLPELLLVQVCVIPTDGVQAGPGSAVETMYFHLVWASLSASLRGWSASSSLASTHSLTMSRT